MGPQVGNNWPRNNVVWSLILCMSTHEVSFTILNDAYSQISVDRIAAVVSLYSRMWLKVVEWVEQSRKVLALIICQCTILSSAPSLTGVWGGRKKDGVKGGRGHGIHTRDLWRGTLSAHGATHPAFPSIAPPCPLPPMPCPHLFLLLLRRLWP